MPHLPICRHIWYENYSFAWLELTNIFSCLSRCWKLELKILWLSTKDLQKARTIKQKRKAEFNQLIYFISRTVQSQKWTFQLIQSCKKLLVLSRFTISLPRNSYVLVSELHLNMKISRCKLSPWYINLQLLLSHLRIKPISWKMVGVNFDERFT